VVGGASKTLGTSLRGIVLHIHDLHIHDFLDVNEFLNGWNFIRVDFISEMFMKAFSFNREV
jgi:hypothetical protein